MKSSKLIQSLALEVALLLVAEHVAAIGPTAPTWQPRELVSTNGDHLAHLGANRTLAYDHHGNPGIAFYDSANDDLRYARFARGIGWVYAIVDSAGDVGRYPSLAFDPYERPAISYHDTAAGLKYAAFDGTSWQISTIISGGVYSSLAFDIYGHPAIAYQDTPLGSDLRFIHDVEGNGFSDNSSEPVSTIGPDGFFPSLAFDGLNRPMIACLAAPGLNRYLRFGVKEPGVGWVTTTLVAALFPTEFVPSLAINQLTGFPAIAFVYQGNLRYTQWNGAVWNTLIIDGSVGNKQEPSLAFDPADGRPAIAYHDFGAGDLKMAWFDGTGWQTQIVDSVGLTGRTPSLAFNDFGNGFPSIAYLDESGNVYFIEDPPQIAGDVNWDQEVNVLDLLEVIGAWGPCESKDCSADLNDDGDVNVLDLLSVIGNWT